MRRFISVVIGVFGLWLFAGGLMSVVTTESGSFIPAMWSNLLLGAAVLAGSVLLWRARAQYGTCRRAHAAGGAEAAPSDGQRRGAEERGR